MMRLFFLTLFLTGLVTMGPNGAVFAQSTSSLDRRGDLLGWEGVGRLDLGDGYCTGVLVAKDLVLTAAHCLYDKTARPRKPERIQFRAGLAHGKEIAARRVTKYVIAEGYRPTPGTKISNRNIASDVALLRLDRPIYSSEADPFKVFDTTLPKHSAPKDVMLVSFGRGRSEALTWERGCTLKTRYRGGILGFTCDATFGSSGAPVFMRQDGRLRIISLISAGGRDRYGKHEALGMTLQTHVTVLKSRLFNDASRPKVSAGAKRIRVGEASRTMNGPRFLKAETK